MGLLARFASPIVDRLTNLYISGVFHDCAIWVAWGEEHLKTALKRAKSFKSFNPEYGTALFTIDPFSHDIFDTIIEKPEPRNFKGLFTLPKIACMSESPFENTVFFDNDT